MPRETSLPTGFADQERPPVFPVFVAIDTSSSMAGAPIAAVNAALPELKRLVEHDPTAGEIARIGIVTFAHDATTVLGLSDLQFAQLPTLTAGGMTNYHAVFTTLHDQVERDIRALGTGTAFYAPVVFFMSDGYPTAGGDWSGPRRALTDPGWKFRCQIVAFGFGEADPDTLGQVATEHAFMAADGPPVEQAKDIMAAIIGSIRTTSGSLRGDPGGGGLAVPTDPDKFTPLPVLEV